MKTEIEAPKDRGGETMATEDNRHFMTQKNEYRPKDAPPSSDKEDNRRFDQKGLVLRPGYVETGEKVIRKTTGLPPEDPRR